MTSYPAIVMRLSRLATAWALTGLSLAGHVHDHSTTPHNFSSSAPNIFSSLNGLLQQWSNTFFPNGHTIVPVTIPPHTLFYHGRLDNDAPPSPEWLAFDIEMSYCIMGSLRNSRMLTYRTVRQVKALYFDGTSASLMGSGTESQMTFLYGDSDKVPKRPGPGGPGRGRRPGGGPPGGSPDGPPKDSPEHEKPSPRAQDSSQKPLGIDDAEEPPREWDPLANEYLRARGLCKWIQDRGLGGAGWGYEGIVRMNAGFEMIWCDFNSTSLKLVSNLNVSVPLLGSPDNDLTTTDSVDIPTYLQMRSVLPQRESDIRVQDEGPHGPGMTDRREPFRYVAQYMWFTEAAKRYGSNGNGGVGGGETRAKIDTCGFFSFYDSILSGQTEARALEERKSLNLTTDGLWQAPKETFHRRAALDQLIRRRRDHLANHVTKMDGEAMYDLVEAGLRHALEAEICSGIAWESVAHEVTAFYARHLQDLRTLLRRGEQDSDEKKWLESVRMITHWLIMPWFEYPTGPYTPTRLQESFSMDSDSTRMAIDRCRKHYVADDLESLNSGERLLSVSIDEVLQGICTSTFRIGLAVERRWLLHFNDAEPNSVMETEHPTVTVTNHAQIWLDELEELMAWLGWVDQWTACKDGCGTGVRGLITRRTRALEVY